GVCAQTTGCRVGKVIDTPGAALPGVTVEARSPAVQGTRTTITDVTGDYRVALLPPGEYSVDFKLDGFAPTVRKTVVVALGKDTTINVTLRPAAMSEEL